jgi:hypothetical protein
MMNLFTLLICEDRREECSSVSKAAPMFSQLENRGHRQFASLPNDTDASGIQYATVAR